MKDKHKGIPINEFFGLKLKMHSILSENNKESMQITTEFNEYKDILFLKNNKTQNENNSK